MACTQKTSAFTDKIHANWLLLNNSIFSAVSLSQDFFQYGVKLTYGAQILNLIK